MELEPEIAVSQKTYENLLQEVKDLKSDKSELEWTNSRIQQELINAKNDLGKALNDLNESKLEEQKRSSMLEESEKKLIKSHEFELELTLSINKNNREMEELKNEHHKILKQYNEIRDSNFRHLNEITELSKSNDSKIEEISKLKDTISKLESDKNLLTTKLTLSKMKNDHLTKNIENQSKPNSIKIIKQSNTSKEDELNRNIAKLQTELNNEKKNRENDIAKHIEILSTKNKQFNDEKSELELKIDTLTEQLQKETMRLEFQEKKNKKIEEEKKQINESNLNLQNEINSLRKEIEEYKDNISSLKNEIERIKKDPSSWDVKFNIDNFNDKSELTDDNLEKHNSKFPVISNSIPSSVDFDAIEGNNNLTTNQSRFGEDDDNWKIRYLKTAQRTQLLIAQNRSLSDQVRILENEKKHNEPKYNYQQCLLETEKINNNKLSKKIRLMENENKKIKNDLEKYKSDIIIANEQSEILLRNFGNNKKEYSIDKIKLLIKEFSMERAYSKKLQETYDKSFRKMKQEMDYYHDFVNNIKKDKKLLNDKLNSLESNYKETNKSSQTSVTLVNNNYNHQNSGISMEDHETALIEQKEQYTQRLNDEKSQRILVETQLVKIQTERQQLRGTIEQNINIISDQKKDIQDKENMIKQLKQMVRNLKYHSTKTERCIKTKDDLIKKNEETITMLENSIKEYQHEIERLNNELKSLAINHASKEAIIKPNDNKPDSKEDISNKNLVSQDEIQKYEEEISNLRTQLLKSSSHENTINKYKEDLSNCGKELTECRKEIEKLKASYKSKVAECERLKTDISYLQKSRKGSVAEGLEELTKQYKLFLSKPDPDEPRGMITNEEYNKLKTDFDELKTDKNQWEENAMDLQNETERIRAKLKDVLGVSDEFVNKFTAEKCVGELIKKLNDLKKQINELKNKMEVQEKDLKKKIQQLESNNRKWIDEKNEVDRELDAKKIEINGLNQKIKDNLQEITKLEEQKKKNEDLNNQNQKLKKLLNKNKKQHQEQKTKLEKEFKEQKKQFISRQNMLNNSFTNTNMARVAIKQGFKVTGIHKMYNFIGKASNEEQTLLEEQKKILQQREKENVRLNSEIQKLKKELERQKLKLDQQQIEVYALTKFKFETMEEKLGKRKFQDMDENETEEAPTQKKMKPNEENGDDLLVDDDVQPVDNVEEVEDPYNDVDEDQEENEEENQEENEEEDKDMVEEGNVDIEQNKDTVVEEDNIGDEQIHLHVEEKNEQNQDTVEEDVYTDTEKEEIDNNVAQDDGNITEEHKETIDEVAAGAEENNEDNDGDKNEVAVQSFDFEDELLDQCEEYEDDEYEDNEAEDGIEEEKIEPIVDGESFDNNEVDKEI